MVMNEITRLIVMMSILQKPCIFIVNKFCWHCKLFWKALKLIVLLSKHWWHGAAIVNFSTSACTYMLFSTALRFPSFMPVIFQSSSSKNSEQESPCLALGLAILRGKSGVRKHYDVFAMS